MPKTAEERRAYNREWRKRNPDYQRNWKARNPNYVPRTQSKEAGEWCNWGDADLFRFRRYGIRPEQYRAMLEGQNGCCAICEEAMVRPCVDHCHSTGTVRGLLCVDCNLAIGRFKDDPVRMRKAISYVQQVHPKNKIL